MPVRLLQAHLSHPANSGVLPALLAAAQAMGDGHALLLRLLCPSYFTPEAYAVGAPIGRGRYGTVHALARRGGCRRPGCRRSR